MKKIMSILLVVAMMFSMLSTFSVTTTAATPQVLYKTHVQDVGWYNWAADGATSGTVGRCLRVEALQMKLSGISGNISYRAHVQDIGWMNMVSNGATAGTTGRCLRVEAIQVAISGAVANSYDVMYRVHVQDIGWMNWVSNGQIAGTTGRCLRIEAIQVKLVPKGTNINKTTFDPIWPCSTTYKVTTLYKYSSGAKHSCQFKYGIDIGAPKGENVLAVESGTVIYSGYSTSSGFGNYIKIQHDNGKVSLYAHLNTRAVEKGQRVSKGQIIGTVGNTSAKYQIGYHLHFELGNSDSYGADGDAYQEYYKVKYANEIVLTQAALKYSTP